MNPPIIMAGSLPAAEITELRGPSVRFIQSHDLAQLPAYGSIEAAGADVRAVEGEIIAPGERRIVRTGLRCSIPSGWELQVRPRSGMALARGITVLNTPGTIDSDYTGELGVILFNTSRETFFVEPGDRIAQIVVAPVFQAVFSWTQEVRETDRGEGGFGSTGV